MLGTVLWSLGGVVTIVLLLIGFGWWSNFKVYERDKQLLSADVVAASRAEILNAKQEIQEALLSQRNRTDESATNLRSELVDRFDQLLSLERSQRDAAIDNARSELVKKDAALEERIRKSMEISLLMSRRIYRELAHEKGEWGVAVTRGIHELKSALAVGNEFFLGSALDGLAAAFKSGGYLDEDEIGQLTELLSKMPGALAQKREQVSKGMAGAKVRE